MNEATSALIELSAALAYGGRPALRTALRRAAERADPVAVEEALLQSYLFLGYPAALRGLAEWRDVQNMPTSTEGAASDTVAAADTADDPAERAEWAEWAERGAATCERIYGGQYARLRSNVAALHPAVERWMVEEGYGKVLSRPGLDLATRELCIIALLAPQDAAPQLYSHLRGALNAGASEEDVDLTMALLLPRLTRDRAEQLRGQWAAVRQRRASARGE